MPLVTPMTTFRSTPPRRGRLRHLGFDFDHSLVSIHAPAKGATGRVSTSRRSAPRFDPRPREGGDPRTSSGCATACSFDPRPREGGDMPCAPRSSGCGLFRSTPPRRGRRASASSRRPSARFRSTPPRRGRLRDPETGALTRDVSIHAPAKGATFGTRSRGRQSNRFDPRPREGGDLLPVMKFGKHKGMFRSTPPRRGRRIEAVSSKPRSPVSIHAPAKGATPASIRQRGIVGAVSIHAPAKGATLHHHAAAADRAVSIHAPAKGATRRRAVHGAGTARFDPRPREGGDDCGGQ